MMMVNNAGNWQAVYAPLEHAEWHGWTFTDTIFPSFLWIVGVAMTLSFAKRVERGDDRMKLFLHAARRAAIIFALGLLLNFMGKFSIATLRIPGVLQRIAVCYLIAAAIYLWTQLRGQLIWTIAPLVVYWALMMLVPVPGIGAGSLEKNANLAAYIDSLFLSGHMWSSTKTWDPEGILSTLPAISTVMFGILAGRILRSNWSPSEKTVWLFFSGNGLIFLGGLTDLAFPINKYLWTSSFSVFMAGISSSAFAFCYWLVDVKGWRRWAQPFAIYGMNAIAVYVLAGVFATLLGRPWLTGAGGKGLSMKGWVYQNVFAVLGSPKNASLMYALSFVLLLYLVAWVMYRRKWFVRF
jgi:predicted acyltransferase